MSRRISSFENDGLTFEVRDDGPVDATPAVLLHGFPERSSTWRDVAPLLHGAGVRTYAPDQRGYSPGARPPHRRDYRLGRLVGDVVALIERIGSPVHLVGHDWGAIVGWTLASQRPDLVRSWTAISVPHPRAFLRAGLTSRQALQSSYMLLFLMPWLPERIAADPDGPFQQGLARSGMTADEVARFRSEILDDGALTCALNWYRALPLVDRHLADLRVTAPTTFVWSDADQAVGRSGVDRTPAWVDAPYELVVLEGVSHWIPTHAPDACAAAILARIGSVR